MSQPAPSPLTPGSNAPRLGVLLDSQSEDRLAEARTLAADIGLCAYHLSDAPADLDAALVVTDHRLELRVIRGDKALLGGHGVACDLTALDTTSGPGRSLSQPLLKAVGIKKRNPYRPTVLDATAGLGEDAWVLASMGCNVTACERNPITHALLDDGLCRAVKIHPDTAHRISLNRSDGVSLMQQILKNNADRPDVVYLDPMFPTGRKTAERKAMRVLRLVSGDDADAGELLDAALKTATHRVVVKRPRLAAPLDGPAPAVVHKGKSLRFDVYPVGALQ